MQRNQNQMINNHLITEKAREFQNKFYFCLIDYAKAFVWITTNCGKFLKWWEYNTTLPASCEIFMQVKKEQLEQTWNNGLVLNWERSTSRFIYILQKNCSKQKNGWYYHKLWGFYGGSDSRKFPRSSRDLGLIPGLGRSPGEGNGTQHHFCSTSLRRTYLLQETLIYTLKS